MTKVWPSVRFDEILERIERKLIVDDEATYSCNGIRWYGQGVFIRERVVGIDIARKEQWLVEPGDILYNKLFAWKGAFAVADDELRGCIVSDKFPTYRADRGRVETAWLKWFFRTPAIARQAQDLSKGAAAISKLTLNPPDFWKLTIPLPRLEEQRRIVSRIEELAAKIEEARALHRQASNQAELICRSIIRRESDQGAVLTPMRELVRRREPDVAVRKDEAYHFAGVKCFGKGVFSGQRKLGTDFSYERLTRLRGGDFVYPKLMAWEGALAVVPPECDGLVVSPEFPVFEVDQSRVLPEVLDVYFRTPEVWPLLAGISTGTNVRRRRLNPEEFLKFRIPLPPMTRQSHLREVKARVDALMKLQAEKAAELDALLPAVLDMAFRGDL